MAFQSMIAANKGKVWIAVFIIATVVAFLTRSTSKNSSSNVEPFFVGAGVTLIIWLGLRLMKTYDKTLDRAEMALKKKR
ncbi:hypothetical protein HYU16_04060 [Candidatus Woesearchaeota archaeon]|nr:hypothetical protein [Candidatus Woesearchaeota archaeon]